MGSAFTYTITATNNPTSFDARGLPPGLKFDAATGVISGTPTAAGTFTTTLKAISATGTGTAILTFNVTVPAPVFGGGTALVLTAVQGQSFSYQLVFSGQPGSYTASNLPPGLIIDPGSGIISGTPTTVGTYAVSVSASNAQGPGTGSLTINVGSSAGMPIHLLHTFGQSFTSDSDGSYPAAAFFQGIDGNFYGGAVYGGHEHSGVGTIFKITPTGEFTLLHSFSGLSIDDGAPVANQDGAYPVGLAQDSSGVLYGTTMQGGIKEYYNTFGVGVVFKVTTAGVFTPLHALDGSNGLDGTNTDGQQPTGKLIKGIDGNFYGVTVAGGSQKAGTLFKVTPAGVFSVVVNLPSTLFVPHVSRSIVQGSDGNFYFTVLAGGSNNKGSIVQMTPGGMFTLLYSYDASSGPRGLLEVEPGTFYGTGDGDVGFGTVFRFVVSSRTLTTLYAFAGGQDGTYPGSFSKGMDGNFYGVTFAGGSLNGGTLYRLTPAGVHTVLHSFEPAVGVAGGGVPSNLIQGKDGNLYGTTQDGGIYNRGTIFELTLAKPTIVSGTQATGILGNNFKYSIQATGVPTTYGATGLPPGVSINPTTGVISGHLLDVFAYDVTLTATNEFGTGTATLQIFVKPPHF